MQSNKKNLFFESSALKIAKGPTRLENRFSKLSWPKTVGIS